MEIHETLEQLELLIMVTEKTSMIKWANSASELVEGIYIASQNYDSLTFNQQSAVDNIGAKAIELYEKESKKTNMNKK